MLFYISVKVHVLKSKIKDCFAGNLHNVSSGVIYLQMQTDISVNLHYTKKIELSTVLTDIIIIIIIIIISSKINLCSPWNNKGKKLLHFKQQSLSTWLFKVKWVVLKNEIRKGGGMLYLKNLFYSLLWGEGIISKNLFFFATLHLRK